MFSIRLPLIPRRIPSTNIRVHSRVNHLSGTGRVFAVCPAHRVQRKAETLLMPGDQMNTFFYQPAIGFIIRQLHRAVCPGHMPVGNRHHMRHPDGGHRIQQPEKLHADGQLHPACLQALRRFFTLRRRRGQQFAQPAHKGARRCRAAGKTIDIQLDACQFRLARLRLNNQGLQIRGQIIQQTSELFIAVMAAAKPQPVPAGAHFFQ
ncbi:Uncharacterised protein [Klebsiella pneumoniae]|nr:Uncharacterised protein [Klebsiella pneumoniae]SBK15575.1 Uncharacterised protein [Klebsiella pneumoniae]SSW87288.1 Uncharacterised protein [Klebsiella pneumoniae]